VKACWIIVNGCNALIPAGLAYLDHLDERNAQVQVGQISADQAQAKRSSNWYNCA
jgi:hypothetical protein